MKNMNNQYRDNYEEVENQNEQQIYEFSEYPQIKEYYSNKMNTIIKKPKKIIVKEIFDQKPQSRNGLELNKGYYKYYTESNSPYHYNQKNLFCQNRIGNNYFSQTNQSSYLNNNMSEGYSSDYNKFKTYNSHKNIFYNSCLREEYSSPTNDRVNIRKKIYRGSQTPQPFRYNYNISINNFRNEENNNEPLIENFKYYEINNIKDRSNKKYNSITRVTGYSNLIPLHRRQIFYNYNDSRNIDIYRNNNINKSYNLEFNNSMINPSTTKEIRRVEIEKKEYNIPKVNSQIKEKIKEYNKIKIQRKQKEESKNEKRKEFVIPPRKQTNEIKKGSTSYTKVQKTTSITTRANDSINAYKRRNENNQLNTKNNLTSKNNTSVGQYQYKQRTKELTNTSRNNKSSININLKNTKTNTNTNTNNTSSKYSKYQRKSKELTTTKSSSNIGSYKYQTKINTENNFKNKDKIEYRKHTGRYKYQTDIDKEILNSRKNYSQSKNVNKIEVVHQNKEKENKYLQSRDNNTSSKVSSYQKTTKTSTSNYKNNNANNYKNSSTNNYKNSSTNNYKNSSTNNYKNSSTNNYKNSSSNYKNNITSNYKNNNSGKSGNYKKRNDNYSSSRLIKETKTTTTTTSKTNVNNYENKRKNNSSYKRSDQNINKNLDENKSIYNKYKFKLSQKVETNVSNASKVSKNDNNSNKNIYKSGNNENVGFKESSIVENRVYELPETEIQNVSSIKKMKMSMRKIALGDNYKYYERKFLLI